MSLPVRFEREADVEYSEAARWYEDRRRGLGLEFLQAVDASIEQVLAFPTSGAAVNGVPVDLQVRRLPVKRFPFHIIYLQSETELRVLAVAHDRRSPGYWQHRVS